MPLHHALKPDWQDVPTSKLNIFQRTARATNGLITPGNFVSALGFTLVALGLLTLVGAVNWLGLGGHTGLVLIIIGRLMDVIDGQIAHTTGTKSPRGETVDAVFDKLLMLGALVILPSYGIISWLIAVPILLQNFYNSALSLIASLRKQRLHPSRAGKYAAWFAWSAICLLTLAWVFDGWKLSGAVGYVCFVAFLAYGVKSSFSYTQEVRTSK